jgi:hypothetical protein
MNSIKVENIEDFETFVNTMELNVRYDLPANFRYKWVKIEKELDYFTKEVQYSWAMEYNYSTAGCVGYIFPLKSSNYVQSWKTEKGARRNFFKRYVDVFEPISKEVRERDNKLKAILA